jgi:DNA polymerase-3 subunit epsilon
MKPAKDAVSGNRTMNPLEIEVAVSALQSTGDFMILRRLDIGTDKRFSRGSGREYRLALCIDTETTGLDHVRDKIIELGIVAFEYDPGTGEIIRLCGSYSGFEDPGCPLAAEITDITGITDEMVAGQAFDDSQVLCLAERASLVIAHNADFDRKFVEGRYPAFAALPWACTVSQIDWAAERVSSRSLEYLLYKCGGFFINAHRALDDAEGLLGLLLDRLPLTGTSVMKALLERSGEVSSKICAAGAPFDRKDLLKQRGYRWNDGSRSGVRGWWTSVPGDREADELAYLAREIYPGGNIGNVVVIRVDPMSRFSVREG